MNLLESPEDCDVMGDFSLVMTRGVSHGTRLRADWEPPGTLFVVFNDAWQEGISSLAQAARAETDVVIVVTEGEAADPSVRGWLSAHGLDSMVLEHNTTWIRDYGPVELIDDFGTLRWVDMIYAPDSRPLDDSWPSRLGGVAGITVEQHTLWMDGGGLINNGAGLCAMTESTFNELADGEDLQEVLITLERFGCHALAVVPALQDEETGHIDVIAQFLRPDVVALGEISPEAHASEARALDVAAERLSAAAVRLGQELNIIRIPLPVQNGVHYSYINGTHLQDTFLVPQYSKVPKEIERQAYELLRQGLPSESQLVAVDSDTIIENGGAIHCVTLGVGLSPLPLPSSTASAVPAPRDPSSWSHFAAHEPPAQWAEAMTSSAPWPPSGAAL